MAGKIVVVGSLNMDLVGCAERIPVVGETIPGHSFLSHPGGKGANQAFAAARLGGQTAMLGCVGGDTYGQSMRTNLEKAGCDLNGLLVIPDCSSGIALIFVADTGENSIMIVPGANGRFSPQHLQASRHVLNDATMVLLQMEIPFETTVAAAEMARRAGARVILDPAPARPLPHSALRLADIITPNETEAAILAGLPPSHLEADQAPKIAQTLQERQAKTVIIKLGDRGCLLAHQGQAQLFPAPKVKAADTTGAGDVFNAALAVALSREADLPSACRYANLAAALAVTRVGAQAASPTREEVAAFAHSVSDSTESPSFAL